MSNRDVWIGRVAGILSIQRGTEVVIKSKYIFGRRVPYSEHIRRVFSGVILDAFDRKWKFKGFFVRGKVRHLVFVRVG